MNFKERSQEAATKAAELIGRMTLEEKLLQLLCCKPNGVPRLGIPSLNAGETLHGVISEGCTSFPQAIALGATFDPALLQEIATVLAREARAVGIHQTFAPMLAIARDPRWGRVEESYGEDPFLVTRMAVAYVRGVQGTGDERFGRDRIIATPKHFVADGEPWSGANGEGFETSERNLREIHFPPFEAAVKEACAGSIMPAHHALNGLPCHMNRWLLQKILREEWGFDGFVTSDMGDIPKLGTGGGYGGYRMVRDNYESVMASLRAGVDVELVGRYYMEDLLKAVRNGDIAEALVDQSAARVLRLKILLLGLAESTPGTQTAATAGNATTDTIRNYQGTDDIWAKLIEEGEFDTPESGRHPDWEKTVNNPAHDALALKAAQKALVLLKNENGLLPLDKPGLKKILVVGPLVKEVNMGGYTTGKPKFFVNLLDGLEEVAAPETEIAYSPGCRPLHRQQGGVHDRDSGAGVNAHQVQQEEDALLADAVAEAQTADVVIALVGHTRVQLGENLDRDHFDLPGNQQQLVEAMQATGKPVVVILNSGNVFSVKWIQENIPAVIQAFYLGQSTGTALAQVLFGEVVPGGRMPMSTPRNVGQSPWYYNHPPLTGPINYYGADGDSTRRGGPLWAFGHGMSYTTFCYGELEISGRIARDEVSTVRVSVENTGSRAGDEVVQLYIRQDLTSLTRPERELKGFHRIFLEPGEKKIVAFELGFEQVKFWKDDGWVTEPGSIRLMIGSSASDIRLNGTVEIA